MRATLSKVALHYEPFLRHLGAKMYLSNFLSCPLLCGRSWPTSSLSP